MTDLIAFGGRIQLILGPMFSGKTSELIRRMQHFDYARLKCYNIKYAKDTRYDSRMCTHDRKTLDAHPAELLMSLLPEAQDCDVIGVDEGQFFPDVVEFCETLANQGKIVIVAALDGTFQRQAFGRVLDLVPLAEEVIKLKAVCMMCYRSAYFTKRITEDQNVEVIGGADKYIAVCRSCFKLPVQENSHKTSTFGSTENLAVHALKSSPHKLSPAELDNARRSFGNEIGNNVVTMNVDPSC